MTRIEKYQEYRNEIAKSAMLGKSIVDSDENVRKYEKAINKINPNILNTMKDNKPLSFDKGVINFDIQERQVSQDITDMFDTLDQATISSQSDKLNNFFQNQISHSILNENNQIDPKWLNSNQQYPAVQHLADQVKTDIVEDQQFVDGLTDKYHNMTEEKEISEVKKLEKVTVSFQTSSKLSKITIGVIVSTSVLLLALFILVIIKGVKG